jgi:cell division protein DivIC
MAKSKAAKRARRMYTLIWAGTCAAIIGVFFITNANIKTQTKSIEQDRQQLEQDRDQLAMDVEHTRRMIEYYQSDEYIEQYAREKLGWVKDGEIRFTEPEEIQ